MEYNNTTLALTTTCENEDMKEKDTQWKGGPFKITFPEEMKYYGPVRCTSNCSWNGTDSWVRTCIPVIGCTICKNILGKMLSSNPVECHSQWKIEPTIVQDIDETFCNLQKKRIQILRTRKEDDSNRSLANNIARCQRKIRYKGKHIKREDKK